MYFRARLMKNTIIVLMLFSFWGILGYNYYQQQLDSTTEKKSIEEAEIISYELKKMNKMVVVEKDYAELYSHKDSYQFLDIVLGEKKVTLLVKTKVQVTYNMQQLKVKLDTLQRQILIDEIPGPKIKLFSEVSFKNMEQSVINTFDEVELNSLRRRAIDHLERKIDQEELKKEAHVQLLVNLDQLYALAKLYKWEVIDNSSALEQLNFP